MGESNRSTDAYYARLNASTPRGPSDRPFYGSLGYNIVAPDERTVGVDPIEGNSDWVTIGGKNYSRFGDPSVLDGGPWKGKGLKEQLIYDPKYGYLLPQAAHEQYLAPIREMAKADDKATFRQWLGGAAGFAAPALAASMGFIGPGSGVVGASGSAFPVGAEGAAFGGLEAAGAASSAPWGVNPRDSGAVFGDNPEFFSTPEQGGGFNFGGSPPDASSLTTPGLSNLANPQNGMQFSMPGISTPGSSGLIPGATGALSSLLSNRGLVSAGANLLGSGINAFAANQAAGTQADSGREANQMLWNMYQQNRSDLERWRTAGAGAVGRLSSLTTPGNQVSAMEMDPGYQFRLGEGQKAIEHSAAARGGLLSGKVLKDITRFGQNFATGEFGNVFNRNASLAGLGQTAVSTGVNAGQTTAGRVGENITGIGNARASGYVGGANALTSGLQNYLRSAQEDEWIQALMQGR